MMITIVMLSGSDISIESFVQKSILSSVIASLYAAYFSSIDFEDRKILYTVLSGITRQKIVSAKFIAVLLGTELLNLVFPITVFLFKPEWTNQLMIKILIAYVLLGSVLAAIGLLIAWIFKDLGTTIIVFIICHICSLFLMNGKKTSFLAIHTVPVGVTKLMIEGNRPVFFSMILGSWLIFSFLLAVIIAQHSEL